ncbi:MAG TPA: energy transducer TonB [Phycisphaerae bacterium]|nr:energy transducer TonB [Phycisphaerae bacterium]
MPSENNTNALPLTGLFTLVLWLFAAAVGTLGLLLHYPRPTSQPPPPLPVQARMIKATLAPQPQPAPPPSPTPQPAPVATPLPAPAAPQPPALPAAPAMIPVAAPDPALSFAVPIAGLTRLVSPEQASGAMPPSGAAGDGHAGAPGPPPPAPPPPPQVAQLTLGQGEGNQPLPDYPRQAILEHQQGTVRLRFSVNPAGKVTHIDIIAPSPWPLLNQAARDAVLHTWHFPPGKPRLYEVPIEFQLAH